MSIFNSHNLIFRRTFVSLQNIKDRNVKNKIIVSKIAEIKKEHKLKKIDPCTYLDQIQEIYREEKGPALMMPSVVAYSIHEKLGILEPKPPSVFLNVEYENKKVFHGNHISPSKCSNPPSINFLVNELSLNNYYCLLMFDCDGCLFDPSKSLIHWMIFNMKPNSQGSEFIVKYNDQTDLEVCKYLSPIPWEGTGHHRIIFAVYRQDKEYKIDIPNSQHLRNRSFDLANFLTKFPDFELYTYSFFQTSWDKTVTYVCLNHLKISEPVFVPAQNLSQSAARRLEITTNIMNKYKIV